MRLTTFTIYLLMTIVLGGTFLLLYIYVVDDNGDIVAEVSGTKQDPVQETANQTEIIKSTYQGIDIITEIIDDPHYHMAVHYPEFIKQSLNDSIKQYVNQSKEIFREKVMAILNNQQDEQFYASLYLSFNVEPIMDDVYAIVFQKETYLGGANGTQTSKIFLIDLKHHRFIEQTNILLTEEPHRHEWYHLILTSLESSEDYRPFIFHDRLKDWIYLPEQTFSNMYLTNDSLVFLFDKYEITAGAAGSPEIMFPIEEVKHLLTDEWQHILNVTDVVNRESATPQQTEIIETELSVEDNESKKQVALTFDDGPHPVNTIKILELLEAYDAKATFFMLGNRVDFYPHIAKTVAVNGHEVGNHSWNHRDFTSLQKAAIANQIERTQQVIESATGTQPTLFRPPYGATDQRVESLIGLPPVLWTVDTLDWKSRNPEKVLHIVKETVQDGSIILLHDIHDSTVEAVALILKFLEEEGYESVTVSELFAQQND